MNTNKWIRSKDEQGKQSIENSTYSKLTPRVSLPLLFTMENSRWAATTAVFWRGHPSLWGNGARGTSTGKVARNKRGKMKSHFLMFLSHVACRPSHRREAALRRSALGNEGVCVCISVCETSRRYVRQKHRGGCVAVKELLCDWCGLDEGHSTILPLLWHHWRDEWSGQSAVQSFRIGRTRHKCAYLHVTWWGAAKESCS